MSKRITTLNHEEIKNWISQRGGRPVVVEEQKSEGPVSFLSVEFDDKETSGVVKEELNWKRFFEVFEKKMLAFQYDEEEGEKSGKNFRFVGRTL